MGELEGPSLLRLQFSPDPVRHVVLLSATLSSRDRFFEELRTKANSQGSSALLFVHGYNVTFADAARRTAQMAYDLGFGGAPIFYSWPSVGETAAYTVDEQNIEWSEANFTMFLRDFLNRSQAQRIYLIGHSMGNRALARAVAAVLAERPDLSKRLRAIILAAPDIDAQVFKRDIAPALVATHVPITMYASADDRALTASKFLAGGYARAGDINDGVVIVTGIETVDATSSDTGLVGHSYFAEQRSMLADIFDTIRNGLAADQRFGLLPVDTSLGRYWKVKR
jgi:esterase/lipase superfamily enzyme